jgi:hypothetical protein
VVAIVENRDSPCGNRICGSAAARGVAARRLRPLVEKPFNDNDLDRILAAVRHVGFRSAGELAQLLARR